MPQNKINLEEKFGLPDKNSQIEQKKDNDNQLEIRKKLQKYKNKSEQYSQDIRQKYSELRGQEESLYLLKLFEDDAKTKNLLINNERLFGQRQLQWMADQMFQTKKRKLLEQRYGYMNSQIMRGRLGVDNLFLGFAFLGVIIIPSYFYFRDKKKKEIIRQIRMQKVNEMKDMDMDDLSLDFTTIDVKAYNENQLEQAKLDIQMR